MKRPSVVTSAVLYGIIFLSLPALVLAQAKPIKGAIVYLKIPTQYFEEKFNVLKRNALEAKISITAEGIVVNGDMNWRIAGFPPLTRHKVEKITTDPQTAEAIVRLSKDEASAIKLYFQKGKLNDLFPIVVATEAEATPYRLEIYDLISAAIFDKTPLASLAAEQKRALCMFADVTANGTKMEYITYKDNPYFSVDLGIDQNVYNDLKLNQVQRAAKIINERILNILKAFTLPVKDQLAIYGLRVQLVIPHKSFLDEGATPFLDKLEIFAPIDLILQFSNADITSQQFIDECIVIVEGNRISVPLVGY